MTNFELILNLERHNIVSGGGHVNWSKIVMQPSRRSFPQREHPLIGMARFVLFIMDTFSFENTNNIRPHESKDSAVNLRGSICAVL